VIASSQKRSLVGLASALFFEYRDDGLRCCMIHPGPFDNVANQSKLVSTKDIADSCYFSVFGTKQTCCVESIDLTTITVPKNRPKETTLKKVAFVTGSSRGIGKGIALSLAKDLGYAVAIVGRNDKALEETRAEIAGHVGDGNVLVFKMDVRDDEAMKSAIQKTYDTFGSLHCLVCSAGINKRRPAISADGKKFADPKYWKELLDINLNSSMTATGYALPYLKQTADNPKNNISPTIFYVGSRMVRASGTSGQQSYIASKYGINGFALSVYLEVRRHGIRISLLNVGMVNTDLGTKQPRGGKVHLSPGEEMIQVEDIADCVNFTMEDLPAHICPLSFDLCQTSNEYYQKMGKV